MVNAPTCGNCSREMAAWAEPQDPRPASKLWWQPAACLTRLRLIIWLRHTNTKMA